MCRRFLKEVRLGVILITVVTNEGMNGNFSFLRGKRFGQRLESNSKKFKQINLTHKGNCNGNHYT